MLIIENYLILHNSLNVEILKGVNCGIGYIDFYRMDARARVQTPTANIKDLEAKSPEEKRLLALSKLGEDGCSVNQS